MKSLLTAVLLIFSACFNEIGAHPFYFAFAEVEFNELNNSLETSIIASAHDLESLLKEKNIISKTLDNAKQNETEYHAINEFLNQHFSVYALDSLTFSAYDSKLPPQSEFVLEGFEVLLDGNVQFYLSTVVQKPVHELFVTFDLLMDRYSDQQNKLSFRYRGRKFTYNFLNATKSQFIKLDV
ncbi:MAG: hypothetical protein FJZ66_00360 [Bacteroidetes bacterium]|nr:hypothetical protein [Bacteroidota bacterium]